jgi:hypothetical protein
LASLTKASDRALKRIIALTRPETGDRERLGDDWIISTGRRLAQTRFSSAELDSIGRNLKPRQTSKASDFDTKAASDSVNALSQYLEALSESTANNIVEHERILSMAPEIAQAAEIVIPSILSPNDMLGDQVNIRLDRERLPSTLSKAVVDQIEQLIQHECEDVLRLSTRLPERIKEALYRSGASVELILPTAVLNRLFNGDGLIKKGAENLDISAKLSDVEKALLKNDILTGDLPKAAVEQIKISVEADAGLAEHNVKTSYNGKDFSDMQKVIGIEAYGSPETLLLGRVKRKRAEADLTKGLRERYTQATGVSVPNASILSDRELGTGSAPLLVELPTESVIPLIVPNNPKSHIGYFVLMDETGNPLNLSTTVSDDVLNAKLAEHDKNTVIGSMYAAFGHDAKTIRKDDALKTVRRVYQSMVEQYLSAKVAPLGHHGLKPVMMNGIYNHLLSRYLEARGTRVVFVPAEFISYLCYQYNEDGTGRSKLESLKFVLSIRISLIVARTMTALNSAMDRKKVTINFPTDENSIQMDPTRIMETVRNAIRDKYSMKLSSDPNQIMNGIADRALTIKAEGMAGLQGFSIDHEDASGSRGGGDSGAATDLSNDIRNMIILGLDVPPSAANALGENEFSRSVATSSLFFARKIMQMQKPTIECCTEEVQHFVRYNGTLCSDIRNFLMPEKDDDSKNGTDTRRFGEVEPVPSEDGSDHIDPENKDASEMTDEDYLSLIISAIRVQLPRPTLGPDKAQYEELGTVTSTLREMILNMYPDSLADGDTEILSALSVYRGYLTSEMLKEYTQRAGMSGSIELTAGDGMMSSGNLIDLRQAMVNLKKALDATSKLSGDEDTDSGY